MYHPVVFYIIFKGPSSFFFRALLLAAATLAVGLAAGAARARLAAGAVASA